MFEFGGHQRDIVDDFIAQGAFCQGLAIAANFGGLRLRNDPNLFERFERAKHRTDSRHIGAGSLFEASHRIGPLANDRTRIVVGRLKRQTRLNGICLVGQMRREQLARIRRIDFFERFECFCARFDRRQSFFHRRGEQLGHRRCREVARFGLFLRFCQNLAFLFRRHRLQHCGFNPCFIECSNALADGLRRDIGGKPTRRCFCLRTRRVRLFADFDFVFVFVEQHEQCSIEPILPFAQVGGTRRTIEPDHAFENVVDQFRRPRPHAICLSFGENARNTTEQTIDECVGAVDDFK